MGARERAQNINRLVWMAIFLLVAAYFAWMKLGGEPLTMVGWFIAAGVWSAICGIGYSICDWLIPDQRAVDEERGKGEG